MRPTPGYIPTTGRALAWNALSTHGVMARTVADAALMLDAIGGYDPGDPLSHPLPPTEPDRRRTRRSASPSPKISGWRRCAIAVRRDFRKAVEQVATLFPRTEAARRTASGRSRPSPRSAPALLHRQFGDLVDAA